MLVCVTERAGPIAQWHPVHAAPVQEASSLGVMAECCSPGLRAACGNWSTFPRVCPPHLLRA